MITNWNSDMPKALVTGSKIMFGWLLGLITLFLVMWTQDSLPRQLDLENKLRAIQYGCAEFDRKTGKFTWIDHSKG